MIRKYTGFFLLLAALALSGCASADRSFLLDLAYRPTAVKTKAEGSPTTIAINRLADSRQVSDKTLIGDGINPAAKKDSFYIHGERVEVVVTDALEDHFKAAGFQVKRIVGWDRDPATADPAWGDVIVGGEVLDLWLSTDSSLVSYNATARTKIKLVMIDARTRQPLTSTIIERSSDRKGSLLKKEDMEELLNDVFSGVVSQVLDDNSLREKLRSGNK